MDKVWAGGQWLGVFGHGRMLLPVSSRDSPVRAARTAAASTRCSRTPCSTPSSTRPCTSLSRSVSARRELHLLTAALSHETDPPRAPSAYPGKLAEDGTQTPGASSTSSRRRCPARPTRPQHLQLTPVSWPAELPSRPKLLQLTPVSWPKKPVSSQRAGST